MHKFLFYNKFIIFLYIFRVLCAHHQEVKIVLYSIWYHHTCRWRNGRPPADCDDTRCCIIQFDLLMMSTQCSKHVQEYNKLITKQEFVH